VSKQEVEAGKVLKLLSDNVKSHVDLSKITKNKEHFGIIVDYWLPDILTVVEIHGIQHYQPSGFGSREDETLNKFNRQINRDSKLRDICYINNINLIEVSYKEKDFTRMTREILELL
jgi:hypothetical protein